MNRFLPLVLAFGATACAAPSSGLSAPASEASMNGRTFVAVEGASLDEPQRPRLEFQGEGRIAGFTGCNSLGGAWRISDGVLQVGPLAVTKRFCLGPAGELERKFLAAVNDKSGIEVSGDRLVATGAGGERMEFRGLTPKGG
jgi:heat shock protein HslJ